LGLERLIADHLRDAKIQAISERQVDESGYADQRLKPGLKFLPYDFIIPGKIPIILEVKYAVFGNVDYSKELALAAAEAFSRVRIVLIVVGPVSPRWETVRSFVSDLVYLDLTNTPQEDIESQSSRFVENLLGQLDSLPILSLPALLADPLVVLETTPRDDNRSSLALLFPGEIQGAVETVTRSFSEIIAGGDPGFGIVEQELDELLSEFTSDHFTSCALRIGRCLELTVYAFAHRIHVNPQPGRYKIILEAQTRLRNVDNRMQDLASVSRTEEAELFVETRKNVVKSIQDLMTNLSQLLADLEEMKDAREVAGPDNLQAILRQAQRQLGVIEAPDEARKLLGELQGDNRIRDILGFRNKAAHGDPSLRTREVPKEEVTKYLFYLAEYVQGLANVVNLLKPAERQTS
jgi:hypothetical protein